jgi:hypothetical protein
MGAASLSDVSRCVINTRELKSRKGQPRSFQLEFEKVTEAKTPQALPYRVEDLSEGKVEKSYYRRILWEIEEKARMAKLASGLTKGLNAKQKR